ncbi:dinitrogenase iron-molybdenum cofactor biosynthesis protein [Vibrio hippocampi]|uniref:Dinitrogenase iron-molybdenum cofactor biosynthesis domain-containing protein n=1 Tax=Vibrio hippocampi TaxID=654686 RepID=A0ABN8DLF1_9VIBR|nr:dinitrogenase iron-molybdenum cofactor biosynthesis protein [Vibrio hippocampi]CAH0529267.1 hypothetical protein VHP8226_03134 [Vibrio hippocampi]
MTEDTLEHNNPTTSQVDIAPNVAQRLAKAVSALPETQPREVVDLLITNLGLPLTEQKLAALSPKRWRGMLAKLPQSYTRQQADNAYATFSSVLVEDETSDLTLQPPLDTLKLRVAVTSNASQWLDGHFGSCLRILVYEVNHKEHRLVDVRTVDSEAKGELRTVYLVSLLEGCDILFTLSIGGPAAAKVTRANIHPVKVPTPQLAQEQLTRLQQTLSSGAPKWMVNRLK